LAVAFLVACRLDAQASFHLWRFTEIFSNEDGSIQFIELRSPSANEHRVANHSLTSDANTFDILTDLPNNQTANKFFILATEGFAALPGAVEPDYIIPDGFFNPQGDTLNWANGTDKLIFTAGQLPLDGRLSLLKNLTTALNTPTNFAGDVGEIDLTPPPTPGDTDDDGDVDLDDLNAVRNNFGGVGDPIAGDTAPFDGDVDLDDLNAVRNNFGAAGSAVPEPAAAITALLCGAAGGLSLLGRRAFTTSADSIQR